MTSRTRLSRTDWIAGALALCAEEGFNRVAVEPLAARLGTTKGSFYWHFGSRDELLQAMLEAWEREHTAGVITDVEAREPADRLRKLVRNAFGLSSADADGRTERAVLAAADHRLVAPVVERVRRARVGYLEELFAATGLPAARARARARVAYATYLGSLQLGYPEPGAVTAEELIDEVVAVLGAP
ncbi:TetR family transcriptional regulator [Propionibacteriaceae bacterium ES.041]|uniref:TetR family transcriptional regulator n=1 Tax=Enemella evansiae TaxID=2016499 RepID=A0A255GJ80_9ACTN|nr:TetR/AcrR family transcriptional regulator [Enemella evansiae]OYN98946.1 TetR family transcriptional regulator [Enemella evansiae]OYO14393.1 TetR family transcriptional regulator [Enemella evansiae]PFG67542.1 TetR family transcriptional regulator [Propionibacteriaceae bacterium ES.041]TDO93412.1 TetR family transcriptional regulator [Enemella evansiae]